MTSFHFINNAIVLVALLGWFYALAMSLRRHLHYLQLEDYSPTRLWRILFRRPLPWLLGPELIGALVALIAAVAPFGSHIQLLPGMYSDYTYSQLIGGLAGWLLWGWGSVLKAERIRRSLKSAKKRLAYTRRARLILIVGIGITLTAFILAFASRHRYGSGVDLLAEMYFVERMTVLWLTISIIILQPFEKISQRRYLADAQRILGDVRPLVIGVTGSYGKTGNKELLAAMLADRYNVFRPPGSYNTLMGVTRAIREGLRPYHEAFVVEMGAYREGSVAKLCDLVHPHHGIITSIGVQHLERFGSQAVIQRAKGELVRALPLDGVAVLNGDDPLCREIGTWHKGEVRYFSISDRGAESALPDASTPNSKLQTPNSVAARNIRLSATGSDFDLHFLDGEVLPVHLSLLGRAAIANATAAAAMADRLGVARSGIARVLATMPHVRHRLEPKTGEGGIIVIDDAFNSNPIGAAGALEVLSMATGGRRVLVTPGMIELGNLETEANRAFGKQAAAACDLAVLVGVKRIEPIRQGLLEGGFPPGQIWVVPTLNEGLTRLQGYLQPGDTMLLENDLPDQYEGM